MAPVIPHPAAVHIVEPRNTAWPVVESLAASADPARVLLIGSSRDEALAHALGLRSVARVSPPLGHAPLAWRGVRRWLAAAGALRAPITVWSPGALAAAALAAPIAQTHARLSLPPLHPLDAALARRFAHRAADIAFSAAACRDAWAGVLHDFDATLERTPPAPAAPTPLSRAELRHGWGASESDRVVLALGDSPRLIDAREFVARLGVMGVGGFPVIGIVPADAKHLERAVRFTRRHPGAWRLLIDDAPPPAILHACDLAVPATPHAERSARRTTLAGTPTLSLREALSPGLESHAALMRALTPPPRPAA